MINDKPFVSETCYGQTVKLDDPSPSIIFNDSVFICSNCTNKIYFKESMSIHSEKCSLCGTNKWVKVS